MSEYYKARVDLREGGIEGTLHYGCRFNGSHKLTVLNATAKSARQMAEVAEQVFDCDPGELRVARVDMAADVPDVPLRWFGGHMRVPRKGIRQYGLNNEENGGTIYYGAGADYIRVYDKAAEVRKRSPEEADREGQVLTRVERQLRSGRIPRELATLEDLVNNAVTFNPFASVILFPGGKADPELTLGNYSTGRFLEGTGFRQLVLRDGLQQVWKSLGARRGNFSRKVRQLSDFVPADPEGFHIPDLFGLYARSVERQLLGCKKEPDGHRAESLRISESFER